MPTIRTLAMCAVLLTGLGLAGAASAAQPLDLSRLRSPYAGTATLRDVGLARTAVEHRAGPDTSLGLGFLCGRQPSAVTSSGAAAYGVDPHGRFLGAQLKMSFR